MFTLQILHASDLEGGLDAIENAPNFAAIEAALEADAAAEGWASVTISAGDNYIPGPFFNAGGSDALSGTFEGFYNQFFGLIDVSQLGADDDANGDGFFDNGEINAFLAANPGVSADSIYVTDVNGDGFSDYFDEIDSAGGRLDIAIMNAIGFDASAVGNHEFDAGSGGLADAIIYDSEEGNSLSSTSVPGLAAAQPGHVNFLQEVDNPGAQFPYLSANLDFSGDGDLGPLFTSAILPNADFRSDLASARDDLTDPTIRGSDSRDAKIAPATTIERDGEIIGVVGATTQLIQQISSVGGVREVSSPNVNDMPALAAVLQPVIDQLIADGVNKIILTSHLQQLALETELASLLSGVDVIIAGGSDTLLADGQDRLRAGDAAEDVYPRQAVNADGDPVLIVSTDGEYSYVGRLVVTFDDAGVIDLSALEPNVSGAFATDDQGVADVVGTVKEATGLALEEGQEVPPVADGPATGTFDVTLDGNVLTVSGTYSGMSGDLRDVSPTGVDPEGNPIDGAHIHNAPAGSNGPVVRALSVTENGDGSGTLEGVFTLTDDELADFLAGDFYINLHTDANPAGELRGQLPAEGALADTGVPVSPSGAAADVQNLVAEVTGVVTELDGQIVGEASVFLNGERSSVRTEETNFGNLTADANLFAARQVDPEVMISLKNGGGIRASIGDTNDGTQPPTPNLANPLSGKEFGEISELDLDNSLRFDNGLVIVELSPEDLKIILEHAVAATAPGATPGQFAQVGGLAFSFDPTATAQVLDGGTVTTPGERIQTIALIDADGEVTQTIFRDGAFDPGAPAEIKAVTLNFLAASFRGDGYPFVDLSPEVVDLGIGEQQAVAEYLASLADAQVIAFDLLESASQNLISFDNPFAGAFSSAGDGFEVFDRDTSASIPFALLDDSAGSFAADDQGIILTGDGDAFFGAVDTENGDNSGPVSASWTFDVAGFSNLEVSVALAAMGDFEASDTFVISASLDGGDAVELFSLVADEDGAFTYTLEDGDEFALDDPMTVNGTTLFNAFQNFDAELDGVGDELTVTVTATLDGGDEAIALRNIVITGSPASADPIFGEADTPIHQDGRIVNLAAQTDVLDAPETAELLNIRRAYQFQATGAEVVDHENGVIVGTNDEDDVIERIDQATGASLGQIDLSVLDGFDGVQSVAIANGVVAAAIKRAPVEETFLGETFAISQPGFVALFDVATGELLGRVDVGNLPDAIAFTPDGNTLVVAGEGEFNGDSDNQDDPLGTIGIVDVTDPTAPIATLVGFEKFSGLEEQLREAGVRVKATASFAADAEPEYVAISPDGTTAFVTLQENNAVAVVDIASATVTDILGLGTRGFDAPGQGLDPLDDDVINIRTFDADVLQGLYMPDAIEALEIGGELFLITANEGDSRGFDEERAWDLFDDGRLDADFAQRLVDEDLIDPENEDFGLGRLEVSSVDGDTDGDGDIDTLVAFSTRGFTIWRPDGTVVFDSGDLAEAYIAANFPGRFNDDGGDAGESRSDAKGPEFEIVETGVIDGRTFLFAGAERDSGVFVFDISDPEAPVFSNYIEGFKPDGAGGFEADDERPEVIKFIPAADSATGYPRIAVSYEDSATVSVFDLLPTTPSVSQIQGAGHTSAFVGFAVTTAGIVTAVDSNGFYLQDPVGDGDAATSDAVFVFTGSAPTVAVGDEAEVSGTVSEFFPGGESSRNLSTTQIASVTAVEVLSSGNDLPAAVIIGDGGLTVPDTIIDDDAFASFDPTEDAIDFFEALEGMRVTATDLVAVASTNRFGEIFAVANGGADASGLSPRGSLNLGEDDFNPEKIQIDEDSGVFDFDFPDVNVGDQLGDVTGVVGYSFGNFEIIPTEDFTSQIVSAGLEPETTSLMETDGKLSIATYNVLNLDPNDADGDADVADGRFDAIAQHIVGNLAAPDIIALQEVQDNSGSADDGVTAADQTLQALVDAIAAAGGPTYGFVDNTFITDNASGGQPGGNIRTAFLYDASRVALVDGSVRPVGDQSVGSPFEGARLPLAADFDFNGNVFTVVNNHFSSKGGSAPILGVEQPFDDRQEEADVNGSLDERRVQAQAVNDFVDGLLAADADADVVVLGDLNEFEFVSPLDILKGEAVSDADGLGVTDGGDAILENLIERLPDGERATFEFQGNAQVLDHILVTGGLAEFAEVDIVNVNSEFAATDQRASDHDPVLALLDFTPAQTIIGENRRDELVGGNNDDLIRGGGGRDVIVGLGGDDMLFGNNGRDNIRGDEGDDEIFGGKGNDVIRGGTGDDVIDGGRGNDRLLGGEGADVFIIASARDRTDRLSDFEANLDRVDLTGFGRGAELTLRRGGGELDVIVDGQRVAIIDSEDFRRVDADDFILG